MLDRPAQPSPSPTASAGASPELTFKFEAFSALAREIRPLFARHWQEIALNKERIPLDPDWDRYLAYERACILQVVTARDGALLAGYLFSCVGPSLHYASTVHAVVDMFWLDPVYRSGWNGVKLFRAAEVGWRASSAKIVYAAEKLHFTNERGRAVKVLLRRLGFKPVEINWSKPLEP